MRVLLISTYELGHQPFGLASPAAWLRKAGVDVSCLDLSRQSFDADLAGADIVGFHLPMHTRPGWRCPSSSEYDVYIHARRSAAMVSTPRSTSRFCGRGESATSSVPSTNRPFWSSLPVPRPGPVTPHPRGQVLEVVQTLGFLACLF